MTYNTTPITSGAAKFSTLDPDGSLFLQENNITRGADPENPITFYNQQTGELNAVNSIITSGGELNINDSDLIGVKRFVCKDFMTDVLAKASDNLSVSLTDLHTVNSAAAKSDFIRVPSNLRSGSQVKIEFYGKVQSSTGTISIQKYDPISETYTTLQSFTMSGTATWYKSNALTVNAGDLLCFDVVTSIFYGKENGAVTKIYYDLELVLDAAWDIVE